MTQPVNPNMTPKQKFIYRKMGDEPLNEMQISLLLRKPEADLTNTLASMERKGFIKKFNLWGHQAYGKVSNADIKRKAPT